MFESLAERGTRLSFGRVTPQQTGQLLTGVGTRLEGQEGEQSQHLRAGLRHDHLPFRELHGRGAKQSQGDSGHGCLEVVIPTYGLGLSQQEGSTHLLARRTPEGNH